MFPRQYLFAVVVAISIAIAVLTTLQPVQQQQGNFFRSGANQPECKFLRPVGRTVLSPDRIWSPRIECNFRIAGIRNLRIDGKKSQDGLERFKRFAVDAEGRETVLLDYLIMAPSLRWPRGSHTIEATLLGGDGQETAARTSFTVEREEGPVLKPGKASEAAKRLAAPILEEGVMASQSPCEYYPAIVIPYFGAFQSQGNMSALQKSAYFLNTLKPGAESILTSAIQAHNPSFSPFVIQTYGTTSPMKEPYPNSTNTSAPGWNTHGIALLLDQDGSYFGVGAPEPTFFGYPNFGDFRRYAASLRNQGFGLSIFLVDEFITRSGLSGTIKNVRGYYDSDYGYIAVDINPTELFHNFIFEGPSSLFDIDPSLFPHTLAHEISHSMGAGHYNVTGSGNLLYIYQNSSSSGNTLTSAQACLLRRMCHNPSLMDPVGNGYGILPHAGNAYTCGNNELEGNYNGLDEECEGYFGNLDKGFSIDCTQDDPGVAVAFIDPVSGRSGMWGLQHTPFMCYSQSPTTSGPAGECNVEQFCGDGLYQPPPAPQGEGCDSSAPGHDWNTECLAQYGIFYPTADYATCDDPTVYPEIHCHCMLHLADGSIVDALPGDVPPPGQHAYNWPWKCPPNSECVGNADCDTANGETCMSCSCVKTQCTASDGCIDDYDCDYLVGGETCSGLPGCACSKTFCTLSDECITDSDCDTANGETCTGLPGCACQKTQCTSSDECITDSDCSTVQTCTGPPSCSCQGPLPGNACDDDWTNPGCQPKAGFCGKNPFTGAPWHCRSDCTCGP